MNLSERLDVDPAIWKPEEIGEKVEGTLLDLEWRTSDYDNGEYPVLTIQADDGQEFVWYASQAAAKNAVKKFNPQPGERVGASYRGLGEAKPGQSAPKRFRFLVDREPGTKPPAEDPEPIAAGATPTNDIPF
jgi:hypothetical protein